MTELKKYLTHLPSCNIMQDWSEAEQAFADTPDQFRDHDWEVARNDLALRMQTCDCGLKDAEKLTDNIQAALVKQLFPGLIKPGIEAGAYFSDCGKYRYALWRKWNDQVPKVLFIALNPSTANQTDDDPTTRTVCAIANFNGYGGVFLLNCFPYISTDPDRLEAEYESIQFLQNLHIIKCVAAQCADVVFAWGDFEIVRRYNIDKLFTELFPAAKCITKNDNGSPGHPMYKRHNSILIPYNL